MRHDESGDNEDEPPCVIGGEREGDSIMGLAKFGGQFIPKVQGKVQRTESD